MENFILPEKWHIIVTDENMGVLSKWFEGYLDTNNLVGICKWNSGALEKNKNPIGIISSTGNNGYSFGEEITFEQFKTHVLMQKEIIGYTVPYTIFADSKKPLNVGDIVVPISTSKTFYGEKGVSATAYSRHLPKEIVETWEPVYKELEQTIDMGNFTVTVKDGKAFHKSDNITSFVKEMIACYNPSNSFGNYSAILDEVTFRKTGCQDHISKLSDWKKVYDLLKEEKQEVQSCSPLSGNIMDRVKTWQDAFALKGLDIVADLPFSNPKNERQEACNTWFKRDVVVEVLNEGWIPDWTKSSEYKYYPWFNCSGGEFRFYAYHYAHGHTLVGGRLVFRSSELAEYAGKQFLDLYKGCHK